MSLMAQPWVSLPCPGSTPQSIARPSIHKALLEVASEGLALIALDLTVLDSPALQEVVHLCGVDGSCPLLILRRGLANPVVDVIGQVAARLVDLRRGISNVPESLGSHSSFPPPCFAYGAWVTEEPRVVAPAAEKVPHDYRPTEGGLSWELSDPKTGRASYMSDPTELLLSWAPGHTR